MQRRDHRDARPPRDRPPQLGRWPRRAALAQVRVGQHQGGRRRLVHGRGKLRPRFHGAHAVFGRQMAQAAQRRRFGNDQRALRQPDVTDTHFKRSMCGNVHFDH
jgi:hypothetical protein